MSNSAWVGVGIGGSVTLAAAAVSTFAAGAGHGTYMPAVALFPAAMLTTLISKTISPVAMALVAVQFPAYGFALGKAAAKRRLRTACWLALLHILMLVTALVALRGGPFL
jgi:hypothetical protein